VPFFYRRHNLFQLITEADEGSWCIDKYVEKHLSNHRDNQIHNIQTRNLFHDMLKEATSQTESDGNVRVFISGFENNDLTLPVILTNRKEFAYFLWSIRDYEENQWYSFNNDGSCTFWTGQDHVMPQLPSLSCFTTHTPDQVEDAIDQQYQAIENKSKASPTTSLSVVKIQSVNTGYRQNPQDFDYSRWTVKELTEELRQRKVELKRNIRITGKNKEELITRLREDDMLHGGDIYAITLTQVSQYNDN